MKGPIQCRLEGQHRIDVFPEYRLAVAMDWDHRNLREDQVGGRKASPSSRQTAEPNAIRGTGQPMRSVLSGGSHQLHLDEPLRGALEVEHGVNPALQVHVACGRG